MRDSDWSRKFLLRSDWSVPKGAPYTTHVGIFFRHFNTRGQYVKHNYTPNCNKRLLRKI